MDETLMFRDCMRKLEERAELLPESDAKTQSQIDIDMVGYQAHEMVRAFTSTVAMFAGVAVFALSSLLLNLIADVDRWDARLLLLGVSLVLGCVAWLIYYAIGRLLIRQEAARWPRHWRHLTAEP